VKSRGNSYAGRGAWSWVVAEFPFLTVVLLGSLIVPSPVFADELVGESCQQQGAIVIGPNDPCLIDVSAGGYRVDIEFSDDATGIARVDVRGVYSQFTSQWVVEFGDFSHASESGNIPYGSALEERRLIRVLFLAEEAVQVSLRVEPHQCLRLAGGTCSADLVGVPVGEFTFQTYTSCWDCG